MRMRSSLISESMVTGSADQVCSPASQSRSFGIAESPQQISVRKLKSTAWACQLLDTPAVDGEELFYRSLSRSKSWVLVRILDLRSVGLDIDAPEPRNWEVDAPDRKRAPAEPPTVSQFRALRRAA